MNFQPTRYVLMSSAKKRSPEMFGSLKIAKEEASKRAATSSKWGAPAASKKTDAVFGNSISDRALLYCYEAWKAWYPSFTLGAGFICTPEVPISM